MILHRGRPVDVSARLEKEIKVYDFLDNLGIGYDRVDHEPLNTMEACEAVDQFLDVKMCKNLFLCNTQKTNFYLLLMLGEKKFVTKDLSKQINSARLSFGDADNMEKYLDLTPGSVTVFGLLNDKDQHVKLLLDKDLLGFEYMACHPCINTSSIKISTKDLMEVILPALNREPVFVSL